MKNFKNRYLHLMPNENKLILKGKNNKILNNIFSKKFDYLENKILVSRLPPLYTLEINHIYTSHIKERRNSIKYLYSINKIVLNNKLKNENIIENYNSILSEFSQSKDFFIKKYFLNLRKSEKFLMYGIIPIITEIVLFLFTVPDLIF